MRRGKTILAAALAWTLLLPALAGCSGGKAEQQPAVSVYELQKAMVTADKTLPEMLTANSSEQDAEQNFGYLSDLDYSKVEGYFLAYSATGLADEIAVIIVKDAKDAPEAEKSLQRHVQNRVELYRNYEPEQVPRAEGAEVFSQGRYAVLIISDDPAAARNAFKQAIS